MLSGDVANQRNFEATLVILLGVPNQGLDVGSWLALARGQANQTFVATLSKNAGLSECLVHLFSKFFGFVDSEYYSFYATRTSPKAKLAEGKSSLSDDLSVVVDRFAAKSGRSWEEGDNHLHPIDRTYSL